MSVEGQAKEIRPRIMRPDKVVESAVFLLDVVDPERLFTRIIWDLQQNTGAAVVERDPVVGAGLVVEFSKTGPGTAPS